MTADSDQARDFASRYAAAWCSGNPEAVAVFFSANGWLKINHAQPSAGRAAIAEAARSFMTAFPNLHVSFDDLKPKGPRVEFHWTLSGTNSGPGGTGKKSTHQRFRILEIGGRWLD